MTTLPFLCITGKLDSESVVLSQTVKGMTRYSPAHSVTVLSQTLKIDILKYELSNVNNDKVICASFTSTKEKCKIFLQRKSIIFTMLRFPLTVLPRR